MFAVQKGILEYGPESGAGGAKGMIPEGEIALHDPVAEGVAPAKLVTILRLDHGATTLTDAHNPL